MKIVLKAILLFLVTIILLVTYLSIIGVETTKFNSQIQNKIKDIDNDLILELKKVKIVLNPLKLSFSAKTLGPKIKKKNKYLEIENIKANISLKSLISNDFSINQIEISTKSIEIRNLISFTRLIYQMPEIIFLEKLFDIKGYLIADLKLEFNKDGSIKNNYIIKGFIKDTSLNFSKNFDFNKINLAFKITKNNFAFENLKLRLNNFNFESESILIKKSENQYLISGNIINNEVELNNDDVILLKKIFSTNLDIRKIKFSSKNNFSLKINSKFKLQDIEIISEAFFHEISIFENKDLKKFFPNFNNEISFIDNEVNFNYRKDFLSINGNGMVFIQNNKDIISYKINKNKGQIKFENLLKIKENSFLIKFLDYEKKDKTEASIKLKGYIDKKNQTHIQSASLIEGKNKIEIKNINFDKNLKIKQFDSINLDYLDKDNQKNLLKITKEKKRYLLKGDYFNSNNLIENILFDDEKSNIFSKDFKINLNIKRVRLDKEFQLENLEGNLHIKDNKLFEGNLIGYFSDNKKMLFTINTKNNEKITTFFIDYAKPIVKRYKFIKGFDEGILDFYTSKIDDNSKSTLKIYKFKLKELPTLTKILTLASLQGIADILSGEGIRFDEFEMNFENKNDLMTIEEIYAIGPAISVLMNGYIEKNKLISLRGTLVPATTINKVIGSIPVLGKILVGSKTGEGVFGVSFKIKGPPKKLETTVNPIKTLTPRFITRTLEKIKKSN